MCWDRRLARMSHNQILRRIYLSLTHKQFHKLLDLAIEKIENIDQGLYFYEKYRRNFTAEQRRQWEKVMSGYTRGDYRLYKEIFITTKDCQWLEICPPDDVSFCVLMIQNLNKNSWLFGKAYERARSLALFSDEEVEFNDLYALYLVKRSKALWKKVWEKLREDEGHVFPISRILRETSRKDVLALWMSKADNIGTWSEIFRNCPVALRQLAYEGIAKYYSELANDPKIYKKKSM